MTVAVQYTATLSFASTTDVVSSGEAPGPDGNTGGWTLEIFPGALKPAKSAVTPLTAMTAGVAATYSIVAAEAFDNIIPYSGAGVTALSNIAAWLEDDAGNAVASADVTYVDTEVGAYSVSILSTYAGSFTHMVTLDSSGVSLDFGSTPSSTQVEPGIVDPDTSSVQGNGIAFYVAGVAASVLVTARDEYGNIAVSNDVGANLINLVNGKILTPQFDRRAADRRATVGQLEYFFIPTISGKYDALITHPTVGNLAGTPKLVAVFAGTSDRLVCGPDKVWPSQYCRMRSRSSYLR
mmetsp:Transcript_61221/g.132976  ORF Transcript_61221/g.132976 Transcript_61221/m.132976 type:complete len:294 (-) Transcript_61221:1172-2053(-)